MASSLLTNRHYICFYWFVGSVFFAFLIHLAIVSNQNWDWTVLICIGSGNEIHSLAEDDFARKIKVNPFTGHDGQLVYTIARDPLLLDENFPIRFSAYRHGRVLYPFLSGLGGLVSAPIVLIGLIFWACIGMGLAGWGAVLLAQNFETKGWAPLFVIANTGLWCSVRFLMNDSLAIGLSILGTALWVSHRRKWAIVILACAVLTKEVYWLTAVGIGLFEFSRKKWKEGFLLLILTIIPLVTWYCYLISILPAGHTGLNNFSLPFYGLIQASSLWHLLSTFEHWMLAVAILFIVFGSMGFIFLHDHLLRWLCLPWILLAVCFSHNIWDLGNNAARNTALLWIFSLLALATLFKKHEGDKQMRLNCPTFNQN
jgi:hypothetical protein